MRTEPIYLESTHSIGDGIKIHFKGENYGEGLQDTAIKIGDVQLCWIMWKDKEAFIKELNEVIDKYRI